MLFDRLVEQLGRLPGIGRKTALRLAFSLVDQPGLARDLAEALNETWAHVGECGVCRNLTEREVCDVCTARAGSDTICVVHTPADMRAIEDAGLYRGRYFVLHGFLSPLDGVGPGELGVDRLKRMAGEPGIAEVILALDATADGEATCTYIAKVLEREGVRVSRLARGLPPGASVEFADSLTLAQAFEGRRRV